MHLSNSYSWPGFMATCGRRYVVIACVSLLTLFLLFEGHSPFNSSPGASTVGAHNSYRRIAVGRRSRISASGKPRLSVDPPVARSPSPSVAAVPESSRNSAPPICFNGKLFDVIVNQSVASDQRLAFLLRAATSANNDTWGHELIRTESFEKAGLAQLRGDVAYRALMYHWRASAGDGLYITDAAQLMRRMSNAKRKFNRICDRPEVAVVGHTAVRLEARALQEWLVYHLGILGYSHILVYLNPPSTWRKEQGPADEGDNTLAALQPFIDAGLITLSILGGERKQTILMDFGIDALHSRLCHLNRSSSLLHLSKLPACQRTPGGKWPIPPLNGRKIWLASHDVDEFLVLAQSSGDNGAGMMCASDLVGMFSGQAGLGVNWQLFGIGGHLSEPHGKLVIDSYRRRIVWPGGTHPHIKSLANVEEVVSSCGNPHCFKYRDGRLAVDEAVRPIPAPGHLNPNAQPRLAAFHHYDSKSFTHLAFKWLRGRATTGERYPDEEALARAASYVDLERRSALVGDPTAAEAVPFLRCVLFGEESDAYA